MYLFMWLKKANNFFYESDREGLTGPGNTVEKGISEWGWGQKTKQL
jgi:hypothetical protein